MLCVVVPRVLLYPFLSFSLIHSQRDDAAPRAYIDPPGLARATSTVAAARTRAARETKEKRGYYACRLDIASSLVSHSRNILIGPVAAHVVLFSHEESNPPV